MALTRANANDRRQILRVTPICPHPLDDVANQVTRTFNYTAGKLTSVDKTIDGVTYRQTWTYTGDDLTGISAWVEQ